MQVGKGSASESQDSQFCGTLHVAGEALNTAKTDQELRFPDGRVPPVLDGSSLTQN